MKKINSKPTIEMAIKSGAESLFWKEGIKKVVEQWIAELTEDILEKDELTAIIKISARDTLRAQRKFLIDLLDIPKTILENIDKGDKPKRPAMIIPNSLPDPDTLDPYPRDETELLKMK